MTFKIVPFADAVRDVSSGNLKLPQSEFQRSGRLPVVDQGQKFIAGYTDDIAYVFRTDSLPVIVFGDHTKSIKYIDFPFAMGADGVKVLKPKSNCDAKYLFHYLRYARIPDAGYSRHYKFLKELLIPLPSLIEQRRIAAILDKADSLCVNRREVLSKLDSVLHSFFMSLVAGVECWPRSALAGLCVDGAPITYGILQPGPDLEIGVPYVRPTEIKNGEIIVGSLRKTSREIADKYSKSSLCFGDILITIVGTIGAIAVVPRELDGANITQSSARVRIDCQKIEPKFVEIFLRSSLAKRQYDEARLGVAVERLNLHHVRNIQVPIPPVDIQLKIRNFSRNVEAIKSRASVSSENLKHLVDGLNQRAFERRFF